MSSASASSSSNKIVLVTSIQRLKNDLDRPSALVRITSPNFASEFQELWDEHVKGFTGLRGKRRERTEKEQNMEWRVRLKEKKERDAKRSSEIAHKRSSSNIIRDSVSSDKKRKRSSAAEKEQQEKMRREAIKRYKQMKQKMKKNKK